FHGREGADQRNRSRDERDDRGAPGLEKDQYDENDERDSLEKCLLHFVDRLTDRNCRVVDNCVVESGGEALLQLSHLLPNRVGRGECVRARELENGNRGRRFSTEPTVNRVITRSEFNPRDVAHASDLSVRDSRNYDGAELFFVSEPALRAYGVLEC